MRTSVPTMDHGDIPEIAISPASPHHDDVTKQHEEESTCADEPEVESTPNKRQKRPAEDSPVQRCVKTSKTSRDTDAGIAHLIRMQKLAHQHHLMDVVHSGDVGELKKFLEQKEGKLDVNFFDNDGQTALHHSCTEGNFELVKLLVKFGADTRLANRDGWNPLHIAAFAGHRDIMLYLTGGATSSSSR